MSKIVRTPTRAEGGITPDEKAQMDLIAEKWISNAFRTDPIEPDKITDAVKRLYADAGLAEPRVVIAPSPLVMAFAYGASAAIWHNSTGIDQATREATREATWQATMRATIRATDLATDQATDQATWQATEQATMRATIRATDLATDQATRDATREATDLATERATRDATREATRETTDLATLDATLDATRQATERATERATREATREATMRATWDATRDATERSARNATDLATREATRVAARACHALAGDFGLECAKKWWNAYQGGNAWSYTCAYIDAAQNVLGLDLPEYEKFKSWNDCALHGGFRVMHEKFCIVSDFPEFIKVDDQNRPHCETGPSHKWRDGWSLYHWHGVSVPAEWIEDQPPMEAAIKHENVEQRRAAAEIIGWAKVLDELGATVIDTDDDPEIGQLLEVDLPEIGRERFIRVKCGTGRDFALPVPPTMQTALQSQAWMIGLEPHEFKAPEVRT